MNGRAALAALLLAPALAGCLSQMQDEADHGTRACDLLWHPGQVPAGAPAEAGPGPREVTLRVLAADGAPLRRAAVAAWWQPTPQGVEALRLRTSEDGAATLRVPDDRPVDIVAGSKEWTHEGHLAADAEPALLQLAGARLSGHVEGAWDPILAQGASGPTWQPSDLPWAGSGLAARLERLDLALEWSNAPEGGADFGIAVGPDGGSGFHYTNREYQASLGPQRETRVLEAAELASLGWGEATRAQAGPSVSTGGFAVRPIPYALLWDAAFAVDPGLPDRCLGLGDADAVDVTGRLGSEPAPGPSATASRRPD